MLRLPNALPFLASAMSHSPCPATYGLLRAKKGNLSEPWIRV